MPGRTDLADHIGSLRTVYVASARAGQPRLDGHTLSVIHHHVEHAQIGCVAVEADAVAVGVHWVTVAVASWYPVHGCLNGH